MSYEYGANDSEAVEKISADEKDYYKYSCIATACQ